MAEKRICLACGGKAKRPECSFDYDCPLCSSCLRSFDSLEHEVGMSLSECNEAPVLIEWASKIGAKKRGPNAD